MIVFASTECGLICEDATVNESRIVVTFEDNNTKSNESELLSEIKQRTEIYGMQTTFGLNAIKLFTTVIYEIR